MKNRKLDNILHEFSKHIDLTDRYLFLANYCLFF